MSPRLSVLTRNAHYQVKREVEGGTEIIEGKLPAVLTVELELGAPRYASLPELVRALRQDRPGMGRKRTRWPAGQIGLKGSPTSVKEIFRAPGTDGGLVFDSTENKDRLPKIF